MIGAGAGTDGKLYALDRNSSARLLSFAPPSATSTLIGVTGVLGGGMVALGATGQIYASQFEFGEDYRLYRINPANGASILIGQLGQAIVAGAFVDGILYGLSYDNDIYTIGPSTGVATFHKATTLSDDTFFTAMAWAVVPEPSTAVLATLGLLMLASRRR